MSDKLVFDLAQEIEGSPNVFVRKDWINILDNQNQNYNNNQSVIDTSQLSNSNKYMSYREAYFSIPFVMTLGITGSESLTAVNVASVNGATTVTNFSSGNDYALGLKNWFGQIIHSFTLDYNGTTVLQQTPYINMWNSFKLMTSLSMSDVLTQGVTIGFYPDDSNAFAFVPTAGVQSGVSDGVTYSGYSTNGTGTVNNNNSPVVPFSILGGNSFVPNNSGLLKRQQNINFDLQSTTGSFSTAAVASARTNVSTSTYQGLYFANNFVATWKSYISNRSQAASTGTVTNAAASFTSSGYIQYSIVASIYLKHVHSFFNMCPLLKGVFMKMTMNLNNTSSTIVCTSATTFTASDTIARDVSLLPVSMVCTSTQNPQAGVNPLMFASGTSNTYVSGNLAPAAAQGTATAGATTTYPAGSRSLFPSSINITPTTAAGTSTSIGISVQYTANISVGATVLNQTLASAYNTSGTLSKSIYLYIPAYTFNPVFEQAYLSNPVKQIKYTDVYQYQILNVASGNMFNNLLTNGIANIKSVLILPYYSASGGSGTTLFPTLPATGNGSFLTTLNMSNNTGLVTGMPVWSSPFDPAGTGPTSPMCAITNFNIQVSGQNAIYNIERYNFEQFNNQLYGQNAVNGGLTDGITSALIDRQAFDMEYCYYYVNVERMLPVEETVPKSIQILGQNTSSKALDLYCFIEYGNTISIDALTGARV